MLPFFVFLHHYRKDILCRQKNFRQKNNCHVTNSSSAKVDINGNIRFFRLVNCDLGRVNLCLETENVDLENFSLRKVALSSIQNPSQGNYLHIVNHGLGSIQVNKSIYFSKSEVLNFSAGNVWVQAKDACNINNFGLGNVYVNQ